MGQVSTKAPQRMHFQHQLSQQSFSDTYQISLCSSPCRQEEVIRAKDHSIYGLSIPACSFKGMNAPPASSGESKESVYWLPMSRTNRTKTINRCDLFLAFLEFHTLLELFLLLCIQYCHMVNCLEFHRGKCSNPAVQDICRSRSSVPIR